MAQRKKRVANKRLQSLQQVTANVQHLYHAVWLRKVLLLSVVMLLLILAYQKLMHAEQLQVKRVIFNGDFEYLSQDAMKASVKQDVVGNLISIRLDKIYQDVMALPWVEDVSVRRRWPGELVISVTEKKPAATWNEHQLISMRGAVFTPSSQDHLPALPVLSGPEGTHADMLAEYASIQALFAPLDLQVQALSQDERQSWQLNVKQGFKIRLGRKAIDERLQRFVHLYPRYFKKQKNKIRYFDMRYSNGLAVAWQEENA